MSHQHIEMNTCLRFYFTREETAAITTGSKYSNRQKSTKLCATKKCVTECADGHKMDTEVRPLWEKTKFACP